MPTATIVSPALAQDVDTAAGSTAKPGAIGIGSNNAFGITFTVGAPNTLDGFSFYVMDNGPAPAVPYRFKAHVYTWDGARATGSAPFESVLQQYPGGVSDGIEYSFDTGGMGLASASMRGRGREAAPARSIRRRGGLPPAPLASRLARSPGDR